MAHVYVRSSAAGAGTGADWANAYTTLAAALTAKAAGDNFWVAADHAETQGSAMTLTSPGTAALPCTIICADHTGSVPPVSADLRTTATVTTTGGFGLSFGTAGYAYYYGITFSAGSGAVNAVMTIAAAWTYFKKCVLRKLGTTAISNAFTLGGVSGGVSYNATFDDTSITVGAANDAIAPRSVRFIWKNTATPIVGATLPTTLINNNSSMAADILLEGLDLSVLNSGKTIVASMPGAGKMLVKDCKLHASVTLATTPAGPGYIEPVFSRCDSAGTNYIERKISYLGTQSDELVIVRTNGASDGTTSKSRKIVTSSAAKWIQPFEALAAVAWNDITGSRSVTSYGIWNSSALPNNDELWSQVEYLGDASSPQGSFIQATKDDFVAANTALTASTQAWDSLVTARVNSTAYILGDTIKTSNNAGRIFFCTTAGTSSSSEPAGYASAVDGGSVTDGTAVFRAGMRFQQTVNFTAGQKGAIYVTHKAAKASNTFYIDPLLALS